MDMGKEFLKSVKEFAIPVKTVVRLDHTIDEALTHLRKQKIEGKITYFYVVDDAHHLKGVVNTRNLLLRDPTLSIGEIMDRDVISLHEDQTIQEAVELLTHHGLLALPVVNHDRCLTGIVDVERYVGESVDVARERHRNDLFQILGYTLEEEKKHSAWRVFRVRMPWILCNMASGIVCAIISRAFQGVLAKFLLLAMFIPLVLTLSESISMQSMTQSIHLIRKSHLTRKQIFVRFFRESRVVLLLSGACGLVVGALSLIWGGSLLSAFSISLSLGLGIALSASMGVLIPIILHSRELDPKVASGPVVLMFADVITTMLYLGLATWWLI